MRLFVAINFPTAVRHALWECAAPLRSQGFPVRWVAAEAIHLTLKFLGEVAQDREPKLIDAIEAVVEDTSAFDLPIGGLGAFPAPTKARVLWIGCEPVPTLELLLHRIEENMGQLGFPKEGRTLRPHLTLGRVRRESRASDLRGLSEALQQLECQATATVHSVDLMQSQLSPSGARYVVRHTARLGP